jgi:hypothetical protein
MTIYIANIREEDMLRIFKDRLIRIVLVLKKEEMYRNKKKYTRTFILFILINIVK